MECEPQVHEIMYVNENKNYTDRFLQEIKINNKIVTFEVDSAAAVTLMTNYDFNRLFPNLVLQQTTLQLKTYCGNNLSVLGYVTVKAELGLTIQDLNLYIVDSVKKGFPLLGREWIRRLGVRLEVLHVKEASSTQEKLNTLLGKYENLFNDDIGKIKDVQATIKLKSGAVPVFCKARQVPFSLLSKVEKEIDLLVEQGILIKVDRSEWATPVVPVSNSNARVRLCGDIHVNNHPLPTIDVLFASMAGGRKFTKLDISQVFLHMEVNPHDSHLLTLNTHKGLYRCTRLLLRSSIRACNLAA